MTNSLKSSRASRFRKWGRLAPVALVLATGILPATAAFRTQTAPSTLPATRPVASLLCRYADVETTYGFTADSISQHMWSGAQSIPSLVQEASLGSVNLDGSRVFGWYTLPGTRASYSADFPGAAKIASDCSAAATAAGVDLSGYTYEIVYLNDVLGGMEGGTFYSQFNGRPPTIVGRLILSNTMVLNHRALNSPGLVLHELGHALGGVHTFSAADSLGGANVYGTNAKFPQPDGTLSKNNVGPGWDAYNRDLMGFVPADRKVTFGGGTQTVELSRLTQPIAGRPMILEVPYGTGTSAAGQNRYVVSARTRIGYDAVRVSNDTFTPSFYLPVPGVMVQRVNGSDTTEVMLSRAGGDRKTADGVFLPGQSFLDPENQITITVDQFDDNGATLRVISGPVVTTTTTTTTTTTLPPPTTIPLPAATLLPSDNYADAPEMRAVGNIGPINNQNATNETGEGEPCGRMIRTMWTKFVVPETGSYTAATAGSDFDTVLAVWRPSDRAPQPPWPWTMISCNDDFNGTPQSSVTFNANAGDTVYLQGASNGRGGQTLFNATGTVSVQGPIAGNLFIAVKKN